MKQRIIIWLLIAGLLMGNSCLACFIMFLTDGKNILVANHEDWYARDAEVRFVPASPGKLGMLYFDFISEGYPQGGMNTAGLFFDGTRTPHAPYPDNAAKTDCHCNLWKKILAECSTVEQALNYVQRFRIAEMEDVHILFADRLGHAAIVGVYGGKLQIHRNTHPYQLLTNFNITEPSYGGEEPCRRFHAADSLLRMDSAATLSNVEKILRYTDQEDLTVYSNIYDLRAGEVYVYSVYTRKGYTNKVKINLAEELKKGNHHVSIRKLFHLSD